MSESKSYKVLVTGADGMLGNNIVRELLNRGFQVNCLIEPGHDGNTLRNLNTCIYKADLLNSDSLARAVCQSDYIIHTAGCTSMWPSRSDRLWRINFEAVKLLVKLSKKYSIKRFIHIGTATSFGYGTIDYPGTEESPYNNYVFRMDYQDSKYAAQQYLLHEFMDNGFPVIILNPTFMIGKFGSGFSSNKMLLYLYEGKIPGYTKGGKNYVHAKDVATASVNALSMGRLGECYITGNANLEYRDAFRLFAEYLNVKTPALKLPMLISHVIGAASSCFSAITGKPPRLSYKMARVGTSDCYYSSEKAIRELNLPQSPLEEAVRDSINWFIETGRIQ